MGPEGLLPWLQEPCYGLCSDPSKPNAHLCTLFVYILILFLILFTKMVPSLQVYRPEIYMRLLSLSLACCRVGNRHTSNTLI
jgi:hypothetical protein